MAEQQNSEELTAEQVKEQERDRFEQALNERAAELSKENGGRRVIPVWYLDPADPENGKPIVGFLLEPNRATKGSIVDTFQVSQSRAQKVALEASFLAKDKGGAQVSDPRIMSTDYLYDAIYLKAGEEALSLVRIAVSQFKKK